MRLQAGTLYRHCDYADIDGAIFELLNIFVAEIAIDIDLHAWIEAAVLRENIGQHVKARGFVRADGDGPMRHGALVRDGEQRFVGDVQHAFGISEVHAASGSEGYVY